MFHETICEKRTGECEPYSHCHCSDCNVVMLAVGGGGDDGREIAGYDDANGNGARNCDTCTDSLLCENCKSKNAICSWCRRDLKTDCGPKCEECRVGAVA